MRAVHQVQSLGLHIKGQEEHADAANTTLLCCIWAMDRMNAAFNGRPVSMHERDLRKDLDLCFQQQDPPFRLFLEVTALLDKIIELYRPLSLSGDAPVLGWEFPAFEDIVLRCGGSHIGITALGMFLSARFLSSYEKPLIVDSIYRSSLPCYCDTLLPHQVMGRPRAFINSIPSTKPIDFYLKLNLRQGTARSTSIVPIYSLRYVPFHEHSISRNET